MVQKPESVNATARRSAIRSPWLWVVGGAVAVLILAVLLPKPRAPDGSQSSVTDQMGQPGAKVRKGEAAKVSKARSRDRAGGAAQAANAERIVASKLKQFAGGRYEIAQRMAKHFQVELPTEVERFFQAVEAGQWEEIQQLYGSLRQRRQSDGSEAESLKKLWGPIMETFGVAEEAHNWPAQTLLDYGHAILDSLRPGMIYIGGTDPGRFIPTLLNETTDGEHHVILTQNAMADNTYLQYVGFLYGDQLPMLDEQDNQRAFQEYLNDAQKRLSHDQQFPNEPRQVRPGEDIRMTDGRLQVSGQIAVTAINERLVQMLMQKNPDSSFAIEQSFPFQSTYAGATTLGPIMELRVQDSQNALTPERAAQAVSYWQTAAQQVFSDPEASDSQWVRRTWSKMASEQGALLLSQNYPAEAEAEFRIANQIYPSNPEAVFRYVSLLVDQKRFEEAALVAEQGAAADPGNEQFREVVQQLRKAKN